MIVWALTDTGHRRLAAARPAHGIPALPESPQHRAWREARSEARQRIEGFRRDMRERLGAARSILHVGDRADSNTSTTLSKDLTFARKRLASATYCLNEWVEPDDATADTEEPRHLGRRDFRRWDRP